MKPIHVVVLASAVAVSAPVAAQDVSRAGEVQHRSDCRLAVQVMETGHPAPHRDWAYGILPHCGADAGPAAVASLWNGRRRFASDELPMLVRATSEIRDRRIYLALRDFARRPGADVEARLHALALLVGYVNAAGPRFEPADLRRPADGPAPPMTFLTHDDPVCGSEATGDVRDELRAFYTEIRNSDPDAVIRNAAAILLKHVHRQVP